MRVAQTFRSADLRPAAASDTVAAISEFRFKFLCLAVLFTALSFSTPGAEPDKTELLQRFEPRRWTNSPHRLVRYRWFKPVSTNAAQEHPLVLFLHGAAGRGEDNEKQFAGGNHIPPKVLSEPATQARFPCFIYAPQCPKSEGWQTSEGQPAETLRAAMNLLPVLTRDNKIDARRVYVIGLSMGGGAVWTVLARHPGTFAAAIPICAAGDPALASSYTQVPIWCFHGGSDPLVDVNYARRMMEAIRRAGGEPKYTEYAGVGHNSYERAFQEPELLPWLFSQRRAAKK